MMSEPASPPDSSPPATPPARREAAGNSVRMDAGELFGDAREIVILHNGREYKLRITQQGKLLLTA